MSSRMKSLLVIISGVLILALGVGAVAVFSTSAASAQTTRLQRVGLQLSNLTHGLWSNAEQGFPEWSGRPDRGGEMDAYLGEALGISEEELQTAYQTAREAAIAQALEEGLITQEQADAMKEKGDGFFGKGFPGGGFLGKDSPVNFEALLADALGITEEELQAARQEASAEAMQAAIESGNLTEEQASLMQVRQALKGYIDPGILTAEALGMSVEELQAARQEGKSPRELMEDLGISAEDFQVAMQEAYKTAVQQAVEDGVITQEQADLFLSNEPGFGPGNPVGSPGRDGSGRSLGRGGEMDAYLGEALGISEEELQTAYQTAREAAIAQALEEGLITQEQADAMKEKGDGFFGKGFPGGGFLGKDSPVNFEALLADALGITEEELQAARQEASAEAMQAAIEIGNLTEEQASLMQARQALKGYIDPGILTAEALGMSVEELQAARQEGKSPRELMEDLDISAEDFQAAMQEAYKVAVQQAVDDGVITQEQADLLLSSQPGFGLGSEGGSSGPGGPGGPGQPGGPGGPGRPGGPGGPGRPPGGTNEVTPESDA